MGKIFFIELANNQTVIGEVGEHQTNWFENLPVLRPYVLVPSQNGLQLAPHFIKKICYNLANVVSVTPEEDIPKELLDGYRQQVSGIQLATKMPTAKGVKIN